MIFQLTVLFSIAAASAAIQYDDLGCWQDNAWFRAIGSLENSGDPLLEEYYRTRTNGLEKCAGAAKRRGFTVFALNNKGKCFSDANAATGYKRHGKSSTCLGSLPIHVYQITDDDCFKQGIDYPHNDLSFMGMGADSESPEACQESCQEHERCLVWSWRNETNNGILGTGIFSKQTGRCWIKDKQGATEAGKTTYVSGPRQCPDEFTDLKCWKNKVPQNVTRLEGTDSRLDKYNYKLRTDAISKCHVVARDAGYDFFAVGNSGQCWAGRGDEYKTYGEPKSCPKHGGGKYGVINVYEIVK